jgi:restriction system protein
MARRRKQGFFDTLVQLPWPAGVVFGLAGFAVFRWGLAGYFGSRGDVFSQSIAKALASGGLAGIAWMFLALGLVAAAVSAFRSRDRATLLDQQGDLESLRALSWARFEQLVGEAYRRQGYAIEETGQGGADGGVDLLLRKDGATTLVQCKQWRSRQVGVSVVREMHGLMHHHGAAAVKIVCTGVFSSDCYRFAVGKPLELVDGVELARLVGKVRVAPAGSTPPVGELVPVPARSALACPKCASAMLERTNRTTGQPFWGCSRYPACRQTLPI